MIVVVDSNVLLSALISPHGTPAKLFEAWQEGRFRVATCQKQIDELRRASRYPKLREILRSHLVGKMLNTLEGADVFDVRKRIQSADDPFDAYLLDLAELAKANYLVTGDKASGLLARRKVGEAKIFTVATFCGTVIRKT